MNVVEVINLRLARKARARVAAQDLAAANRAKFGRSTGERAATEAEVARLDRGLDGAKRGD